MKSALIKHRAAPPDLKAVRRVLPQIETLIEASRQHVISTANLTLVWLYWNVGRVITQDIQQNQKRAEYGEKLLQNLGTVLKAKYGEGFSLRNLRDMRRFFECFAIRQTVSAESSSKKNLPPLAAESLLAQICQTPSSSLSGLRNSGFEGA